MTEGARVPKLRFQGFNAPWDSLPLSAMGNTYSGLTGKTKADFGHGKGHYIPYTNVYENSITDVSKLEAVEIDAKQNTVQFGDVLFTVSSEVPEEVAMSSVWLGKIDNTYLNSFCFGYRQYGALDSNYLAHVLRSKPFRRRVIFLAQGISRFNISKKRVMDIPISVPHIKEQRSIGSIFNSLDSLIALAKQKHQKLVELKQAMLEKMFPREGETVPELRFPGFTEPWYEKQFTDAVLRISTIDNSPELPRIEYEDINSKYGTLNKDLLSKQTTKSGILFRRGDVLYGKLRPYLGNWLLADFTGIAVGDFWILRPLSVTSEFLYCLIQSKKFQLDTSVSAGSKMPRADWSLISQKMYRIPTIEEQEAIGQFFTALDDRIAKMSRRVDKLKQLKQALLEKMFV